MKLRWREFLIAFILAGAMWYSITGSEKIESQVKVRLEYKGTPAGLIVREDRVNEVRVRIRASVGKLRSMVDRDYIMAIDLSTLAKGSNVLPIPEKDLPFNGGVEVVDITPSRIEVVADTLETRKVTVKPEITGTLPPGFVVSLTVEPEEVSLRGPAGVLADIRTLRLPLAFTGQQLEEEQTVKKVLTLPEGVIANPADVSIVIRASQKRKLIRIIREIQMISPADSLTWARPGKVTITLDAPEFLVPQLAASSEIKARVIVRQRELGSYTLPVQVDVPPEVGLVKVEPAQITVTVEQQETVTPKRKR